MPHKTHLRFITLALVLGCWPVSGYAQDDVFQESAPQKPDLSQVDAIEMPPMDPYTLTFVPPMPEGARNIQSKVSCEKAGGRWIRAKQKVLNVNLSWQTLILDESLHDHTPSYGCQIDRIPVGMWLKSEKTVSDVKDDSVTGFVWFVEGQPEGWVVNLTAPGKQTSRLSHYKQGIQHGTTFEWDVAGVLRSVETFDQGVLHGKYEKYQECLPTVLGTYDRGKPSGIWELSEEPGMIYQKVYYTRKALDAELPDNTPDDAEAYWTEWFNGEGVKIAEGYGISNNPTVEAQKVGKLQFYSAKGKKWITVQYNGQGSIADTATFERCAPEDNPNAPIPAYIDYDHENLVIHCKNHDSEVYRQVHFYQTGELWKTENYRNDLPHGWTHEYHPTGELLASYMMKNGVPDGKMTFLNRDGSPMSPAMTFREGNGTLKALWYNGKTREEGQYVNGKKEGQWTSWFNSGVKQKETHYAADKQSGIYQEWYLNGVPAVQMSYLDDARHGDMTIYYPDGRIAASYQFEHNKIKNIAYEYAHSGSVEKETDYTSSDEYRYHEYNQKRYYNDGSLQASGKIIPGFGDIYTGEWKYYLKNSDTIWYTAHYSQGLVSNQSGLTCESIHGKYIIDSDKREVGCQVCAVNRKSPNNPNQIREGTWEWFNEIGKLEKRGTIHLGHLNGLWEYFYPNGNLMLRGNYEIDQKMGKWEGYFSSGGPKFQGQYQAGTETGDWITYHESTQKPESKGQFVQGKRQGPWTWYYDNGQIREQGVFENGKETGTWTQYYPSGAKNGEGAFIQGKREGLWTWWREDGTLWRTAQYAKGKEIHTP